MAGRWEAQGAELLHVVDLDGAFEKAPRNVETIKRIADRVHIPVELGGGIRTMDTIAMYLELGIARVILGTEAISNPNLVKEACDRYPGKVMVSLDARDGMVAIGGWTQTTQRKAIEVAEAFDGYGLAGIVFTDIHRDGMQTGPNIEQTKSLAECVSMPIIASGGVSNINDIRALLPLQPLGVEGVITGKALYAGTLDLKEALEVAKISR
jgi:phosphoribosylformimino-5-aminoimidazole carboxamide ribotide isomerase